MATSTPEVRNSDRIEQGVEMHRFVPIVGLLVLPLAACDEPRGPLDPGNRRPARSTASIQAPTPRGPEREALQVAQEIPGFAGRYWDRSGNLHVLLVDTALAGRARERFHSDVQSRPSGFVTEGSGERLVMVHQARYSYAQLLGWKQAATRIGASTKGVTLVGYDLKENRIRVGVISDFVGNQVLQLLVQLGVPSDAVKLEVGPPTRTGSTLRDQHFILKGGLAIKGDFGLTRYGAAMLIKSCTLGLAAYADDGTPVILTNSHCTGSYRGVDGTDFLQPSHAGRTIASEYRDPMWRDHTEGYGSDCPNYLAGEGGNLNPADNQWYCRWSDAALGKIETGEAYNIGAIARTTYYGTGSNAGSRIIDDANPQWQITHKRDYAYVGDPVHKVGEATGWTWGEVIDDCADIFNEYPFSTFLSCQQEVTALYANGDSGSPAFTVPYGGSVELIGLTWGFREAWGTRPSTFIFSALLDVEWELGILDVGI